MKFKKNQRCMYLPDDFAEGEEVIVTMLAQDKFDGEPRILVEHEHGCEEYVHPSQLRAIKR